MVDYNPHSQGGLQGPFYKDSPLGLCLLVIALIGLGAAIVLALLPGILNDPTAMEVLAPAQVEYTAAPATQ